MVNEAMQNGTQQQFGGGNQSGFGTFAKNSPTNQQQNGGDSRPTSALSGGRGGGGTGFGSSRNGGDGTANNGAKQTNVQQEENGSPARENTPQPPPQRPDSQTQGSRGGFGSRPVSRQGAEGTDFGDVPMKKPAGTGANTAPLGTRRGSGFGGRGPMAATNSTENAENGVDSTNTNAAENTEAEAGKENRRQTGFGGAPKMGGRGGGFGGRGGGGDRNAGGGSVPNARFNGDENGGGGGRRVGFGGNASGVGGRGGGFSSRGDRENGGGGFNRAEGGRGGFNRAEGGGGGFNRAEGGGGFRQPREGGDAGRFEQNGRGSRDFINRGPGARFGDFGSGFARFETSDEREAQASHVPVDRTIDEIVAEDTKVSENYKTIFDEDDECVVTGLPDGSPQQMLDNWNDASFEEQLLANIERSKYIRPRKIQSLTIPLIMDGHDIKGHAETGSGKSAAFLLPIINLIMQRKKKGEYEPKRSCPYCLIIEPTRELAYQLYDQARKLAENTGVTVSKAYGKFKVKENAREISTLGCDILVGTPGRLLHFFEVKYLECEKLKMLVLDEADQLLEDDFARVLRQLPKIDGFPKIEDRQTLLFSATFAPEVQVWANDWLKKENVMVSNKKPVSANSRVVQRFEIVERAQKNTKLLELLEKEQNEAREENPANPAIKKTLVFVKMKRTADLVSTYLNCKKLKSTTINGDRSQKLREESLNDFRNGKFDIVVTTDVCARGIDIKELDHVINLDLPIDHTTYVHRIGRTGRLKEGNATSFFDPSDDMELAKELVEGLKNIGQEVPKWLEEAADGKMPMVEVPNPTMNNQQNSWGGAGFGSCFGGNDNAAATNGQQATAGNEAENDVNDGSWGGGPEIKKEPTDENAPGNVEAPVVGNGPVQGGSRPSSAAAAVPTQSPKMVSQQNATPPAEDGNDDW